MAIGRPTMREHVKRGQKLLGDALELRQRQLTEVPPYGAETHLDVLKKARSEFKLAVKLDPDDPHALKGLADTFYHHGIDWARPERDALLVNAVKYYKTALKQEGFYKTIGGDDALTAVLHLGKSLNALKRHEEAVEHLRPAVERQEKSFFAIVSKVHGSLEEIRPGLKPDFYNVSPLKNELARALIELKRHDEAIDVLGLVEPDNDLPPGLPVADLASESRQLRDKARFRKSVNSAMAAVGLPFRF